MSSPFLEKPESEWICSNDQAFAIYDGFPVSPGHALIVPHRLIPTWFDATPDEQHAIMVLLEELKAILDEKYHPDGYNIGINAGRAAGQTVMHLHVHLIPRYENDVADPRGGIRHVMPSKGNYFKDKPEKTLITGSDDHFIEALLPLIARCKPPAPQKAST